MYSGISPYTVKSLVILDSEGKRIAAKHYTTELPTLKEQLAFEKVLFDKGSKESGASSISEKGEEGSDGSSSSSVNTTKGREEVMLLDGTLVVYQSIADVYFFITARSDENELILASLLSTLNESLNTLLRGQLDKKTMLENLDYILLAIDETIDGGIILESEAPTISNRVLMKDVEGAGNEIEISEQSFSKLLQNTRDQLSYLMKS
eukprot:TRINITY_DN2348_c0_g1_i1.p1 TRINITY_DN2348_c0_g1~~TRINITY_DN2348_c0_g1_i1.p1  ORF type:complete len:233 (-),score=52.77 TRINITY_DN2348_c0_g1_i1:130-750(-)